jgi:hypothetical protein
MKSTPKIIKEIQQHKAQEIDYSFQKSISYSQMSMYLSCPHKWNLQYKEGLKEPVNSVNLIFGTAIHETLQHYITVLYEQSGAEADRINLEDYFHEKFTGEYKKQYEKNAKIHFSSPKELNEFYEDGINIIDYFKKKRSEHFSKKGWHLVGCEIPVVITPNNQYKNVVYNGFLDLVLYHEPTNTFKIIDFKTSTRGWNDEAKKSEDKQFQLILYKIFLSQIFNIPIDSIEIEFIILKRKLWEKSDYPQSRIQTFSPPSGKIKAKKTVDALNKFITSVFELDSSYKNQVFEKKPSKSNCMFCPFKDNETLCDKNVS